MSVVTENWYNTLRKRISVHNQSVTNSLEMGKSKNQILVLDGLRAVACLAVISYHLNFLARNYGIWNPLHGINNIIAALAYFGESGVILFFLLSGFLLFLPFAKALLFNTSWPSIPRFYLRRIFRIIPGYYVALFLIILFFHPEFFHRAHWHDVWLFLTFRMEPTPSQAINGPFWTLAVEFQFYLLLPILAGIFFLIVRRGTLNGRLIKLTLCLLAMLVWGLLVKYWGMYIADTTGLDFLIPHTISAALKPYIYGEGGKYFEVFAVGMLLCMIYVYTKNAPSAEPWDKRLRRLSPLVFSAGLGLLILLSFWHFYYLNLDVKTYTNINHVFGFLDAHMHGILQYWIQWQAIAYAISYGLCMCGLLYGSSKLKSPFEWPLLRWIGFISFSLYMWHLPFIFLFVNVINHNISDNSFGPPIEYFALCCWTLFIIFPLSLTFYRWIEMPGIRVGEFLVKKVEQWRKQPEVLPMQVTVEATTIVVVPEKSLITQGKRE